uniref:Uncharacterized protein AlNc14C274G10011 n=1 Tax=Albugo laibachii Nc14 TaxID=890382 RepID=F0WUK0_9STRA|nr:conserved hypothetical protein [Albugo laibachii Nc14]|eukprot:CCA25081.1 conserved hypothetical protein [Albugo laibachii Nc14]
MTVRFQKEKIDQQEKSDSTRNSSSSKMHAIQRVFGRKSRKNTNSTSTESSRRHTLPNKYPDSSRNKSSDGCRKHESLLVPGRRGLFEVDDDNDSLEALRVKAKERHIQKRNELERLKSELGNAFKSIQQLEMRLASSEKSNAEAQMSLKECQKTVEKRNRQLMKASEKIEALTKEREAAFSLMKEQTKDVTQNAKKEAKRLEEEYLRQLDMNREDWDSKLAQSASMYEAKVKILREQISVLKEERKSRLSALSVRERKKYQDLLMRCERAEASNTQCIHQLRDKEQVIENLERQHSLMHKQNIRDLDQTFAHEENEVKIPSDMHPHDPEHRPITNENHIASSESELDDKQKHSHHDAYKRHPSKGSSINFFDKISFRFKKNVSSEDSTHKSFVDISSTENPSFKMPSSRNESENLGSRPRLHIPESAFSKDDESSDSMFGSDSEGHLSPRPEDQEAPPSPPPPPPPTDEQRHLFEKVKTRAESPLSSEPSSPLFNETQGSHKKTSREASSSDESDDQGPSLHPSPPQSYPRSSLPKNERNASEESSSTSDEDEAADSLHDARPSSPRGKRSKSRMNQYMEKRARKHQENIRKEEEKVTAESRQKEEYDKEWEQLAQEERERKKKQQQRRTTRRRPASMKSTRFSQVKQQFQAHQQHSSYFKPFGQQEANAQDEDARRKRSTFNHNFENESVAGDVDDDRPGFFDATQPSGVDAELHHRQQARLRERHEMELIKKKEAQEADAIRGDTHRRVEKWAFGKALIQLILTMDDVSSLESLKENQIMVAHSPDNDTLKKAYRFCAPQLRVDSFFVNNCSSCRNIIRIIHPDKLRDVSIAQQLEAQELFMVLNQAFESHKAQLQDV